MWFKQLFQCKEKQVYYISMFCLLITAVFSLGFHHFDEHFQILEFAGMKLGLTTPQNLPWEYRYQMRPALQPAMVFVFYKFLDLFGMNNPFTITFLLRLISASLTFLSMWLIYKVYKSQVKDTVLSKWFLLLSFLLWFAIYNGVRFSSENWSGQFFIIAFSLFFLNKKQNLLLYSNIGTLLGLSFLFRYQTGFLVFGFIMWMIFIKREKFVHMLSLFTCMFIVIFLGVLIDKWFYGEWTFTTWNYFQQNILHNKVSGFGVSPWWDYLAMFFTKAVPPFSLVFILAILITFIFKPKSPITWCVLPFLALHFMIGHKEMRFLYPIIGFLPIMVVQAFEIMQRFFQKPITQNKTVRIFMQLFFGANFVLLIIVMFRPANDKISLYRTLYNEYPQPTTLYYVGKNPYSRVTLDIRFYTRPNLSIKELNSMEEASDLPKGSLVVFSNKEKCPEFKQKNKRIYMSYPEWLTQFNFNNWLDRTKMEYVYEVTNGN